MKNKKIEKKKSSFTKANYVIMLIGISFIILGFFFMSIDKEQYGFGFFGITLGPIIIMLGFITQFVAIFYTSKSSQEKVK